MKRILASLGALPLLAAAQLADAQLRCDCSRIVGTCAAEIELEGSLIEITTDRRECSRVDYLVDGQPFVTLVVDGAGRQSVAVPTTSPVVTVESCRVCADSTTESASVPRPSPPTTADADEPLRPLIQVQPEYPPAAAERKLEGWVELAVTVDTSGAVQRAELLRSEPAGVFDAAASAAVMRWRYPPVGEPRSVVERIEFRMPAEPAGAPLASAPAAARATSAVGPRNACVREGSRFNFGDRVEVALINACAEPLAVFGCAIGTGRFGGRWSCTTTDLTETALVSASDERAGRTFSVASDDGVVTATYSSRFLVSRAPNSETWWLACGLDDADCLDAGRGWVRALDGQLSNVDPQGRSRVALARSY
ncbi:MAG: energy transducer TonB [Gammaproteobacteria bacterium]|nr:hypothetical protein [Gammaproteobacteria bacterium]